MPSTRSTVAGRRRRSLVRAVLMGAAALVPAPRDATILLFDEERDAATRRRAA